MVLVLAFTDWELEIPRDQNNDIAGLHFYLKLFQTVSRVTRSNYLINARARPPRIDRRNVNICNLLGNEQQVLGIRAIK
jgi:hypothetical protein